MTAYEQLKERPRKFVDALLKDTTHNATAAYIAADYRARGNAAEVSAHKLLRTAKVQAALAERRAQLASANDVTPERVIEQWRRVAFFDPAHLATLATTALPLTALAALPLEVRTALDVTILATEQGTMVTIRPKNSHAALQHLAKNLRLFGDDPLQELGSGLAGLADTLKALAADGARYR